MEQKKYIKLINFIDLSLWDVKRYFNNFGQNKSGYIKLKDILSIYKEDFYFEDVYKKGYGIMKKINFGGKLFLRNKEEQKNFKGKLYKVPDNSIIYSKINLRHGCLYFHKKGKTPFGVSSEYPVFLFDDTKYNGNYIKMILRTEKVKKHLNSLTNGIAKARIKISEFLEIKIPLPSLAEQNKIVEDYKNKLQQAEKAEKKAEMLENEIESYLMEELGIEINEKKETGEGLQFVEFKDLERWDLFKNFSSSKSKKYENGFLKDIVIGSPMYGSNVSGVKKKSDTRYIRITDINESGDLNDDFVSPQSVDEKFLLQKNDFLIARSGNTVGKTFLYTENYGRAIFAGYLVKYQLDLKQVNPKFILFYTKSFNYKKWIEANQRIAGQPNINGQEYLFSPIILPPLEIQNKIVQHISELKLKIKELKELSENLKNSANRDFQEKIFN